MCHKYVRSKKKHMIGYVYLSAFGIYYKTFNRIYEKSPCIYEQYSHLKNVPALS